MGARVIAVDLVPEKLALARELGAAEVVDAAGEEPVEAVRELTRGGAQVSVDALGSAETFRQGVESLAPRGRHLQLGLLLAGDAMPRAPMHQVIRRELQLLGGHGMQAWRYGEMLEFIRAGGLPLQRLVGDRRPLGDAGAVLASMGDFAPVGVTLLEP